jgi:hypothetical protein
VFISGLVLGVLIGALVGYFLSSLIAAGRTKSIKPEHSGSGVKRVCADTCSVPAKVRRNVKVLLIGAAVNDVTA